MQINRLACSILFTLCVVLIGCGKEDSSTTPPSTVREAEQQPIKAELVVEASKKQLMQSGQPVDAMQFIESKLPAGADIEPLGFHAQIDRTYEREGQRLISITPTHPMVPNQAAFEKAAEELFTQLKAEFDAYAKQVLADELAYQQTLADTAAQDVKQLQQALQTFQEARRGLPQTDASRLERRKLERQIETTLQTQIDANKRVEELQRQVEREQFVKLLRVR